MCKITALQTQVGGNYYKNMSMQPIELITALECSFIQGCIIKYISRYKYKNEAQDIKKCIHYAQLAIEFKDKRKCNDKLLRTSLDKYFLDNNLTILQKGIIMRTVFNNYEKVIQSCNELLQIEYPKELYYRYD